MIPAGGFDITVRNHRPSAHRGPVDVRLLLTKRVREE